MKNTKSVVETMFPRTHAQREKWLSKRFQESFAKKKKKFEEKEVVNGMIHLEWIWRVKA